MTKPRSECDVTVVLGIIVVFSLPLTLLIPDFSVWDVIPKFRVTRCLILAQRFSWPQINAAIITLLIVLFCLYLEIRKRKLDDLVDNVITASQATDKTMDTERERQTTAMHCCMELLDASEEHYEQLVLLRDELRRRAIIQHPPTIEPSASDM